MLSDHIRLKLPANQEVESLWGLVGCVGVEIVEQLVTSVFELADPVTVVTSILRVVHPVALLSQVGCPRDTRPGARGGEVCGIKEAEVVTILVVRPEDTEVAERTPAEEFGEQHHHLGFLRSGHCPDVEIWRWGSARFQVAHHALKEFALPFHARRRYGRDDRLDDNP